MNTLSRSNQQITDEECLTSSGAAPIATTGEKQDIGVSVDYVHTPNYPKREDYNWYAMTATYQREDRAAEHIRNCGVLVYYPTVKKQDIYKTKHGRTKARFVDVSLIPGMFFIYTDFKTAESFVRYNLASDNHLDYLHFTYNKTKFRPDGKHLPLIIPNAQMDSFINLFATGIDGVGLVGQENIRFKSNDIVEITGGEFQGIRGRVARIKDETRVVVTLENICFAATTFVPKKYLKKIEEDEIPNTTN